jgi:hypothetical protein
VAVPMRRLESPLHHRPAQLQPVAPAAKTDTPVEQ